MDTEVIEAQGGAAMAAARRGAEALRAGKLVGFATETVYGVAAAADNPAALERLRDLKGRPKRPFSVHLGRAEDAGRYVRPMPVQARWLISRAWPGPVTILVPTGGRLADEALQAAGLHDVLTGDGLIGLRCPASPATQAMLADVDAPVAASSANLAGGPSPRSAREVLEALGGRIDLLLDGGPTRYGKDSTIVRFGPDGGGSPARRVAAGVSDPWRIVRQGVLDRAEIEAMMRRMFLFVCTGNTCRSPLAEALARKLLAERLGCPESQLADRGVEVASAGLFAFDDGGGPSATAVQVAREMGADVSGHRSRKLTTELINAAEVVFCMTASQVVDTHRLAPSAEGKVRRLCDGDVPDPAGGDRAVYRKTAQCIRDAIQSWLDKELS